MYLKTKLAKKNMLQLFPICSDGFKGDGILVVMQTAVQTSVQFSFTKTR